MDGILIIKTIKNQNSRRIRREVNLLFIIKYRRVEYEKK